MYKRVERIKGQNCSGKRAVIYNLHSYYILMFLVQQLAPDYILLLHNDIK